MRKRGWAALGMRTRLAVVITSIVTLLVVVAVTPIGTMGLRALGMGVTASARPAPTPRQCFRDLYAIPSPAFTPFAPNATTVAPPYATDTPPAYSTDIPPPYSTYVPPPYSTYVPPPYSTYVPPPYSTYVPPSSYVLPPPASYVPPSNPTIAIPCP